MSKGVSSIKPVIITLLFTFVIIAVVFWPRFAMNHSNTLVVTETRTRTVGTVTVTVHVTDPGSGFDYEIRFSPGGGCEAAILGWIQRANRSIHIMVFSITLNSVGDALISAHRRGIDVRILIDRNTVDAAGSEYGRLKAAGIPVRLHTTKGLMHNKVAVIDGYVAITGSYNWTNDAETENNENILIIRNAKIASTFESEFQKIWNRSTP